MGSNCNEPGFDAKGEPIGTGPPLYREIECLPWLCDYKAIIPYAELDSCYGFVPGAKGKPGTWTGSPPLFAYKKKKISLIEQQCSVRPPKATECTITVLASRAQSGKKSECCCEWGRDGDCSPSENDCCYSSKSDRAQLEARLLVGEWVGGAPDKWVAEVSDDCGFGNIGKGFNPFTLDVDCVFPVNKKKVAVCPDGYLGDECEGAPTKKQTWGTGDTGCVGPLYDYALVVDEKESFIDLSIFGKPVKLKGSSSVNGHLLVSSSTIVAAEIGVADTTAGGTKLSGWAFILADDAAMSYSGSNYSISAGALSILGDGYVDGVRYEYDRTSTSAASGTQAGGAWTMDYSEKTAFGEMTLHLEGDVTPYGIPIQAPSDVLNENRGGCGGVGCAASPAATPDSNLWWGLGACLFVVFRRRRKQG